MNKIIVWVILFAIAMVLCKPQISFAQDTDSQGRITYIEEGVPAPWEGYLYDITAAAKLKAQLDAMDEACQIKIDKSLERQSIEYELRIEQLQIDYDTLDSITQLRISSLNDIIDLQERELERIKKAKPELYLSGGVAVGIGLTILAAWGYGQVAHGPAQ